MTPFWQDIAVAVIVLAAGIYFVQRMVRRYGRKNGLPCDGCSQCPVATSEKPLITITPATNPPVTNTSSAKASSPKKPTES
jgi:hypothetical protein